MQTRTFTIAVDERGGVRLWRRVGDGAPLFDGQIGLATKPFVIEDFLYEVRRQVEDTAFALMRERAGS